MNRTASRIVLPIASFIAFAAPLAGSALAEDAAAPVTAASSDPAEASLTDAFKAALANDFKGYLALVHASEKATPQQVSQLERYTFGRFARQATWYLKGNDPASFVVERREELGLGKVKLFLKDLAHPSRTAAPVTLEKVGAGFVLLSNSL
jgi:hypothetical protein